MHKRTRLAIVLFVLAGLLIVGGAWYFVDTTRRASQHVTDVMTTERAAAGQTAVYIGQLTRQAP